MCSKAADPADSSGWLELAERRLESPALRIFLSILILISVLPSSILAAAERWWFLFLAAFGFEFILRSVLLVRRRLRLELRLSEIAVLALDLVALISLLPFWTTHLQILRFARLLLLLGYWRGLLRELWSLLTRRERRYQIVLVLVFGAVLAFGSAVVLVELGSDHDFNADGAVTAGEGRDFGTLMWWSFRQIQDPGNLVQTLGDPRLVVISLLLTFAGLLLFSFFIGIGTTVVGELVERARLQPLGLSGHTVILGAGSYSGILLRELAQAYRKNSRSYKVAMMADAAIQEALVTYVGRHFRFRPGDPARVEDLERVSVDRAKRVIILGSDSRDPDAEVISAILALRKRNPHVPLYPDLDHERNFAAARTAGGRETHLVGSGSMLGYYVAQNIAYPGVHHLYRHLLQSSHGCEIYTYIFDRAEREAVRQHGDFDIETLHLTALEDHRTTLLGFFVAEAPGGELEDVDLEDEDLEVLLHPLRALDAGLDGDPAASAVDGRRLDSRHLRGLIGIAPAFRDLQRLGRRVRHGELPERKWPHGAGRAEAAAADAGTQRRAVDLLRLQRPRQVVRRVLMLGAGPRVPRVLMELIGFYRQLDMTVLAGVDEPLGVLVHDTQTMLEKAFGGPIHFAEQAVAGDEHAVTLSLEHGEGRTTITLLQADWTHSHRLEQAGVVTLAEADAIVFLPTTDDSEDRDGRVALDCLHLAHLERAGKVKFKAGTHVLALVRDPSKGDLLEQRLVEMGGSSSTQRGHIGCRYTVASRELARHRFLMQSVFVRGLNSIYLRLLSSRGQYLSRVLPSLEPGDSGSHIELADLGRHLLAEHRLLLVGYESRDADGAVEVNVDPQVLKAGRTVAWREIDALYVLGNGPDIQALAT